MFETPQMDLLTFTITACALLLGVLITILLIKLRNKVYNDAAVKITVDFFEAEIIKDTNCILFTANIAFAVTSLSPLEIFLSAASFNARLPDMLKSPVIIRKELGVEIKSGQTMAITKRFEMKLSQNEFETLTAPEAETSLKIIAKIEVPTFRHINLSRDPEEEKIAGIAVVPKPGYKIY